MENVQEPPRVASGDEDLVVRQHKLRRGLSRQLRKEAADLEVHQQDILNERLADHYRRFPAPWRPSN